MTASGQVLVVGSLNADLVVRAARIPGPGETVAGSDLVVAPGGKSANQAVAIGRLGGDVALLGRVGDDENGRMLLASLTRAGVDVTAVGVLPDVASGSAMIAVADSGENSIIVSPGANGRLTADDVSAAAAFFDRAGSGSVLTLCLEVSVDAVTAAAEAAAARGITVVLNLSPYQAVPARLLSRVDILLVNAHELADLTDHPVAEADGDWSSLVQAARDALGEAGPATVIVTLGADGARHLDLTSGQVSPRIPSPAVTAVDTTGAGDAFLASFAYRLAAGDDISTACEFAVRVGAYAATGHGAQDSYPTAAQLGCWSPQ